MKRRTEISNPKKNRRKKIIALTSLFGLSLLSITAVTSCSSANASSSSSSSSSTSTVNTNNGASGFASSLNSVINNDLSLKSIAAESLKSTTGSQTWLEDKAYQLLYNWFSTSSNSMIQNQFSTIKKSIESTYTTDVNNYKNEYGTKWEYYVQNDLLDPAGGTIQDYLQSEMYSKMLTQFESDIFNTNSSSTTFSQFLSFEQITKNGTTLEPYSEWNSNSNLTSSFINNPSNWASNTENNTTNNWNLGFFPSNLINGSESSLLDRYCNFDQYLFDQWVINENPFICSSVLYEYSSSQITNIYNSSYFSNLSSSTTTSLSFPAFDSTTNNQFDNNFLNYLKSATITSGTNNTTSWYANDALNYWYNQGVYSDYSNNGSYNTGGFNFNNATQASGTGYFVTNDSSLASTYSKSYDAFNSYVPSYAAAAINRYNVLLFDQKGSTSLANADSNEGGLYNLIGVNNLQSDILANFLYSGVSSASFTPGYYSSTSIPASFDVYNPQYSYLYYNTSDSSNANNGQILNSSNLQDFWNWYGTNNIYRNDIASILTFTPLYGSSGDLQISPYTFVRDADGVHIIAIDGYYRILEAEQDSSTTSTYSSAIASPIDVYPDPTNQYEAGIDAIAQDILWRQEQLDMNIKNGLKIDLFTYLEDYFKANFAKLLLGYAEELISTSSSNYNPLFGSEYNLFSTNNIQDIFNTSSSKEEIATVNLIYDISILEDYITEQNSENSLKTLVLETYTANTTSSDSSSDNDSYGQGTSFYENGIKPAFPYYIDLSSSLLYPYLSRYIYHLTFTNTLGLFYSSNGSFGNLTNNAANVYNGSSLVYTLDEQTTSLETTLNNDISSYLNAINLTAWNYSNGKYAKYSQYVFTNNYYVNAAIEALSKSTNGISDLVENDILANALQVDSNSTTTDNNASSNELSASSSNQFGLANSIFSKIADFSSEDTNYGNNSYLTTALIYEDFLSSFADTAALSVEYGYNFTIPSNNPTSFNSNIYLPNSSDYSTWESNAISNVTNTIANYYLSSNYLYSDDNNTMSSSTYNSYLKLLETINYLYDDGSWANLWNYLSNELLDSNDIAYIVWASGDSSTYLNNTYVSTSSSSSLSNTGSNAQYVNALNSAKNSSYNTMNANYGTAGYSYGATNISDLGYSPFNYIPNANLDGDMLSQFMDQNLANSYNNAYNLPFNNISTFVSSLSDYFNLANVDIGVSNGSSISTQAVPFTGFIGWQTSSDDTALSDLGLSDYLFTDANYTINGDGLLAKYYGGLGNYPTSSTTSEPSGSLMSAILNASYSGDLVSIGETLNALNTNLPAFSNTYLTNQSSIAGASLAYAQKVYNDMVAINDYQRYFEDFSGYVSNITSTPSNSYFTNQDDMYNLISGGSNLEYNNLYTTWSDYEKTYVNSSHQSSTANWNIINYLAQDRLLSATSNSNDYDYMMYVDEISSANLATLNSSGQLVEVPWTTSTWTNTTVWKKLGLTQDAFMKLLVQIASTSSVQTDALDSFTSATSSSNSSQYINKITVYDLRFRTALGALWVYNWFEN